MINLAELKRLEAAATPGGQYENAVWGAALRASWPDILALLEEAREIVDYLADFAADRGLAYAPADVFLAKLGEKLGGSLNLKR